MRGVELAPPPRSPRQRLFWQLTSAVATPTLRLSVKPNIGRNTHLHTDTCRRAREQCRSVAAACCRATNTLHSYAHPSSIAFCLSEAQTEQCTLAEATAAAASSLRLRNTAGGADPALAAAACAPPVCRVPHLPADAAALSANHHSQAVWQLRAAAAHNSSTTVRSHQIACAQCALHRILITTSA